MRVAYKPFYRRFGKLASYKDEILPSAENTTPEQVFYLSERSKNFPP